MDFLTICIVGTSRKNSCRPTIFNKTSHLKLVLLCLKFAWCKTPIRFTLVKAQFSPCFYAIIHLKFINRAYQMKNLAELTPEEKDKINVDPSASGIAYKERLNMSIVISEVKRQ